jgi:lipid-A-disaccharide synthase
LKKEFSIESSLVKVDHLDSKFYENYLHEFDKIYDSEDINQAMHESHFALATSGTVTLATAIFELPTVVCYKASLLNEFIFKNFIKYKGFISLTNIICDEDVFPELVQDEVIPQKIYRLFKLWFENQSEYNRVMNKLRELKPLLTGDDISIPEYMAKVINE